MDSLGQNSLGQNPLGQNQEHPDSHSISQAFPFDTFQNDSFNSMFTGDPDHSFQTPWQSDAISDHQAQPDPFRQGTHGWHQNTLPTSNALQQSGYGLPSRDFGTPYSRNPTGFNYPAFDPHPSHAFSAPAYDPALSYTPDLLVNGSAFHAPRQSDYLRTSSPGQTISPQALQGFPTAYEQPSTPREYQSQQPRTDPNVSSKGSSSGQRAAQAPAARDQGRAVAAAVPAGTVQGRFVVKPSAQLSSATDSTELKSFVFVGNSAIEIDTTKTTLPKYNQRRCKNEVRRLLLREKGDGPWSAAREPLLKKLKISAPKSGRPRSAGLAAQRGASSVEYESSADSSSESESEEDSDYYSGSEEDLEPEEPPPLAPSRPDDPVEATKYDVVKAVWAKRSSNLTGPVIRAALGDYWNVIKAIRDNWKTETTALQQAEEGKDQSKIKNCQRRAAEQRRIMESAIDLTLKHGHRDIVAKLGENALLFLVFYQFIADRFKEGDYSGSLIASILELMTRCITLDQAVLEKTKVDKVLARITKKGSDRVKALAQKVLDNAAANNTQKSNDTKPAALAQGGKEKAGMKVQLPNSRAVDAVVGMKRQRESESAGIQASKKINASMAIASSVAASSKNLGSVSKRTQSSKADIKAAPPSNSSTPAPKPKANHIVAKPSGFFSSLQSASKKPGTSNAALQSAQQKDGKKATAPDASAAGSSAAAAAVPKPAFSFAETMANLTKPKEAAPAPKAEEDRSSETAEERTKRLRKEERRKLRVSFKPDDSLVQVRTFVHEPEEETGHEDSMVRDVDDIGGEGRMLKMHKDLDDMDDEEDTAAGEETLSPWRTPSGAFINHNSFCSHANKLQGLISAS